MVTTKNSLPLPALGWPGAGVPEWRNLVWSRTRRAAGLLCRGRMRMVLHLSMATLADVWNFHLWRAADGAAECPCCGWRGPAFLAAWDWRAATLQSRCPLCNSRSRHRGLEPLLGRLLREKPEGPILVLAPESLTLEQMRRLAPQERVATADAAQTEVERLSLADASFSLIVCNHVLPVVRDDVRMVQECARLLKPGGIAVFTAPGDFHLEFGWYFPRANGGAGFRRYGMDLMSRLQAGFGRVEAVDLGCAAEPAWRVRRGDHAFVCVR